VTDIEANAHTLRKETAHHRGRTLQGRGTAARGANTTTNFPLKIRVQKGFDLIAILTPNLRQ
jgi:hypothetical protein